MSTHNISFYREIRKYQYFSVEIKAHYLELWVTGLMFKQVKCLMLSMLGKFSADDILEYFSYFFLENGF